MDSRELLTKLQQIEEQAHLTLTEFPNLVRERQCMIISLCRFIATDLAMKRSLPPARTSDVTPSQPAPR